MNFIPDEIQCLPREIKRHVEKCYLANMLDKKTFKSQYENFENVDYSRVIKEIADRVSIKQPPAHGFFSWHLTRQLLIGTFRIFLYIVMSAIAKAEKTLNKVKKTQLSDQEEQQNWDSINEFGSITDETVVDQHNLLNIPLKDAHLMEKFDNCDVNLKNREDMNDFRVSIFDNDTDVAAVLEKESSNYLPNLVNCSTPKRKGRQMGEDDFSAFGTPPKYPRRNLAEEFSTCDPVRLQETDNAFQATIQPSTVNNVELMKDVSTPQLQEEPEQIPIAIAELSSTNLPSPEQETSSITPDIPKPIIPKRKPKVISAAKLRRRMGNIYTGTVPLEDLLIHNKKISNSLSVLLNYLTLSFNHNAGSPRLCVIEDRLKEVLRFEHISNADDEMEGVDLREFENTMTFHETSSVLNIGEKQVSHQEITMETHEAQEQNAVDESSHPIPHSIVEMSHLTPPLPYPQLFDHEKLPDTADPGIPVPDQKIPRRRARLFTDAENIIPVPDFQDDSSEIYHLLEKMWQEKKVHYNMEIYTPVDFDEFVKPTEVTIQSYVTTLKSCLNFMRDCKLTLKQSVPYGTISLCPMKC